MNENDRYQGGSGGGANPPSSDRAAIEDRLRTEKKTVSGAVSEASDAVTKEAKALGTQAHHLAEDQADKVKEATASHMDAFANALRVASDELNKNQSGPAAEMVSHAASGLEGLTRSLHGKSTSEMIETVRQFGRDNPIGFLAGSVLAGLALGRFASAASTTGSGTSDASRQPASNPAGEREAASWSSFDERGTNR